MGVAPAPNQPGYAPAPTTPHGALAHNAVAHSPAAGLPRPALTRAPPTTYVTGMLDPSGVPVAPPPPGQPFVALDNGFASPRHLRLTTRVLPATSSVLGDVQLPLAALVTPFADPEPGEAPIPLSNWTSDAGPVRCARCRGYLSCFATLSQDMSRWECPLCASSNDVPDAYRAFVQTNFAGGPPVELRCGAVEFEVPAAFGVPNDPARRGFVPQPAYCFVLDATHGALRSGALAFALHLALNATVGARPPLSELAGGPAARFGVVAFDEETVRFYDAGLPPAAGTARRAPRELVVSDYDSGFSPLPPAAFLHPVGSEALQRVADLVRKRYCDSPPAAPPAARTSVAGAALAAACDAMRHTGGRVLWFTTTLPTLGQGRLPDRELPNLVGKEEESSLFCPPKEEVFFNNLAVACVRSDVCVDVFAVGAPYVDAASLVQLPSTTGGQFVRVAGFSAGNALHRQTLERAVVRSLSQPRALAVQLKARTSNGLRVLRYLGHGFPDEDGALRLSSWSADTCVAVELEHDGTRVEPGKARAYVQVAALYTGVGGARRLRVFNAALPSRESPEVVAAAFDPACVALVWAKKLAISLSELKLSAARQALVGWLMEPIKAARRRHGGTLALGITFPENQELMLVYATAMFKSAALLLNRAIDRAGLEPYARADARIVARFRWLSFSPDSWAAAVYPAVWDVTGGAEGHQFPPRLPASSEFLRADGLFFIHDGGDELDLFVGSRADAGKVEALLGTPTVRDRAVALAERDAFSASVAGFARVLLGVGAGVPVVVGVLGLGELADVRVLSKLVEDKVFAEQSYASFAVQVQQALVQQVN